MKADPPTMNDPSELDDPALWSVDRVVQELCQNQHADWAGSGIKVPVPRAPEVEQAFRENDIDGDVLLQLRPEDFQSMNFTSLGQINKLNRIILFLRGRSLSYSTQVERSLSTSIIKTIEPTPSFRADPHAVSLQPSLQSQAVASERSKNLSSLSVHSHQTSKTSPEAGGSSVQARAGIQEQEMGTKIGTGNSILDIIDRSIDAQRIQEPSHTTTPTDPTPNLPSVSHKRSNDATNVSIPKRQRIQPVLESDSAEVLQDSHNIFNVPLNRPDASTTTEQPLNSILNAASIPPLLSQPGQPDHNNDHSAAFERLLQLYPVHDDDYTFPLYGHSDEEDREMTAEESTPEPEQNEKEVTDPNYLTRDQVNAVIDECLDGFVEEWRNRKLDLTQKKAHQKWQFAITNPGARDSMLQAIQMNYGHIVSRLTLLRRVVGTMQYTKTDDVKKQCESLQVSVQQREEYALYSQALRSELEPPCPTTIKRKRPKDPHPSNSPEDDLCESDDYDSLIDFISSDDSEDINGSQGIFHNGPTRDAVKPNSEAFPATDDSMKDDGEEGLPKTPSIGSTSRDFKSSNDEKSSPTRNHRTEQQHKVSDWDAEDADDEDAEGLHSTSKQNSAVKQRAAEGKIRNPLHMPVSANSSDSDDVIDGNRLRRSQKGKVQTPGKSTSQPIILTSPSIRSEELVEEDAFEVRTPNLNPVDMDEKPTKNAKSRKIPSDAAVESKAIIIPKLTEVAKIPWKHVRNDPASSELLALAKAVSETDEQEAISLLQYLQTLDLADVEDDLKEGLIALRSEEAVEILGVPKNKQDTVFLLTILFMCYVLVRKFADDEILHNWEGDLAWSTVEAAAMVFRDSLVNLLQQRVEVARKSRLLPLPALNASSSVESDSVDTGTDLDPSSRSKRPGKGKRSSHLASKSDAAANAALDTQRLAKRRVADQEARKAVINHRLAQTASQSGVIEVPVNFKEPLVLLDQHIAQRIKPHQINGVQFIWREIIEDVQQQGCLLAHTMGLGKTMQVISVLVTIAQCLHSTDPDMKSHIPPHLHDLRILILSPPALCENWFDELVFWMPKHDTLGPICNITNKSKRPYYDIKQWSESGGVLLLGYDRLVSYTKTPPKAQSESHQQHAEKVAQHENMARWLFDLPKIVIADEAHMLKNPTAKRAEAAMKLKTMSRIALTGSPLSNHLEEYWAMINFIAPGYLGEISKFKQKFVEPINRCLSADSGNYDKRLGLRKMHVLKKILDPKVNRADITAIQYDLPSKTEFFITVPLTDIQLEMYKICVNYFRNVSAEGGLGRGKTASLLQWIAVLSLLCNHPWTFQQKLKDPDRKKRNRKGLNEDSEDYAEDDIGAAEFGAEDVDFTGQPTMLEAMKLSLAVPQNDTEVVSGLQDVALSNRMMLVKAIIQESLRLHEKILVFSHSLLTLDYMELMLYDINCSFERIDGGLATDKRQRASKEFNAGTSQAQVFLISTRAGGLGLNLFGANRVIIMDYSFNPSWEEQAIGRAYRLGQKKPVFVYRFRSGGTFEDVTFNQTIFKTQLFTRIIDHKAVLRKSTKFDAGRYLVDPSIPPMEDFSECKGKDPQIMDKLMNEFNFIRNIVLTETFAQDIDEGLTAMEIEEANQEIEDERLARDDPNAYMVRLATRSALKYQGARTNAAATPQSSNRVEQILATTLNGPPPSSTSSFPAHTLPSSSPAPRQGRQSWSDDAAP